MFLIFASALLLAVIIVQNILYPPLRNETISDGLYGPYHGFLDGAYVILSMALVLAFKDCSFLSQLLSYGTSAALLATAFTNTYSGFVDKLTNGKHALFHTWFTIAMFLQVLTLEAINDHGFLTWLTDAGVLVPLAVGGVITALKSKLLPGPVAEKTAVFLLCLWLICWSSQ